MAAGVGKTYRMLQEGHAELDAGRDVVIGYLEPHGRAETEQLAVGLPQVARRRLRRTAASTLAEMDLPGVLARAPELALIDELAHTNAPGAEHAKRYEDVEDVLAAGIDVFSTVNVQHLESLNDQVAELTGVRVRETFPDSVLSRRRRGRARRRHAAGADRAPAARQGLQARARAGGAQRLLPHGAPRGAARGRAAAGRRGRRGQAARPRAAAGARRATRVLAQAAPQAVGERLLAIVTPQAASQRIVRRAWRSAQRLGARARHPHRPAARPRPGLGRAPTRSTRCAASARCSARPCSSRRATTSPRWSRASRASGGRPTC